MVVKKQFIAGAICPACGAQDTIAQLIENDHKQIECVSCGHQEKMSEQTDTTPAHGAKQVAGKRPLENMIPVINVEDNKSSN